MQHGEALTRASGKTSLTETVASGKFDELEPRMAALCRYAVKLTVSPGEMSEGDVDTLRAVDLDDRAIVDANQVTSYFNYVNRVVDGLGVELEPRWPEVVRRRRSYPLAERRPHG